MMRRSVVGSVLALAVLAATSLPAEARWYVVKHVRVTYCCTPVEKNYASRDAFLAAVKINGWGREANGRYIGWYGGSWHYSTMPMNAHGGRQGVTSAAVDPAFIKQGLKIKIFGKTYIVDDMGPHIKGHLINLWAGEGNAACNKSNMIVYADVEILVDP